MAAFQAFDDLERQALAAQPQVAIVLGSGMGTIASSLQIISSTPFSQIPGITAPSVQGHAGRLIIGEWSGKCVLIFDGRLHFYEGHSWDIVTRPIRIAHALGARILLATNAAGGIHPRLVSGSLMTIRDHLDWTKPTDGHRRASSASPYSSRLRNVIHDAADRLRLELQSGFYAAVTGPNYETPAEIRAMRSCGADAVGMSTIREIEVAYDLGMECAAMSCITNRAAGLVPDLPITHQDVLQTATANTRKVTPLIASFIEAVG
jgi:purine-nucleoside phosphorylase